MELITLSLLILLLVSSIFALVLLLKKKPAVTAGAEQIESLQSQLEEQRKAFLIKSEEASSLRTEKQNLENLLQAEKEAKSHLNENLSAQFKNMANEILKEQSKSLNTLNSEQVSKILSPLESKIKGFQETIRTNYEHESKQRISLKAEIENNLKMNQKLSQDAQNLTKALKGDKKLQGNFGELKLETVLQSAGLQKDKEYTAQLSLVSDDGKRQIPDYTVNLPDNRKVIIDSKVTLNSWVAIAECEDSTQLEELKKDFFRAIKSHVDALYKKNYQGNSELNTIDLVLMYLPFESSYQYIYDHNQELITEALEKGVVIASSATLLSSLKTISTIWRKEYQDRNAKLIAEEGGKLYDKFVGFVDDMQKIGASLDRAKGSYDDAFSKLSHGRGNIVSKAEKMKEMGAKANKTLPDGMVESSKVQRNFIYKK